MKYVYDIVEYIWNHKAREKTFPGWTKDQFALAFQKGFQNKLAAWSENEEGKINGTVLCTLDAAEGRVHVVGIICDNHLVLKGFINKYHQFYTGFKLSGLRRGKEKDFTNYATRF